MPIMMLGILRSSSNWVTMGIEPPERMYTVSFPKISRMASTEARAYLLSVFTTHAGPLLCTLMLIWMPLGVTFFTYSVYFFRMRSEEHTSELQSLRHLVCRLLLDKKENKELNRTRTTHKRNESDTAQ